VDEAAVRAALLELTGAGGAPLVTADEIAQVAIEGDWIGVVIGKERPTPPMLGEIQRGLALRFPEAQVEVRAGGAIHRGGRGWGKRRQIVAVLGGKGGVGKSTVSVNLALTLAAMGMRVGLLDADMNGPDVPHMLGVHPSEGQKGWGWSLHRPQLRPPSKRPRPVERYDIEVVSVGFVVPERHAPNVGGRSFVASLLRFLTFEVAWTADVLVIDAPPGTGDEIHGLATALPLDGVLFVTTPQDLAQMDAERTLTLLRQHDVAVIGMVQNMAALTCPHCHGEIDLFADSTRLVDEGVPVLARIPFDVRHSAAADRGRPLVVADPTGPVALEFARTAMQVRRWLKARAEAVG
jgi:ATP-binding protein involved in chromosome partitioning